MSISNSILNPIARGELKYNKVTIKSTSSNAKERLQIHYLFLATYPTAMKIFAKVPTLREVSKVKATIWG